MEIKVDKTLYTDEEILNDIMYTQRQSADYYNQFAYECHELNLQDVVLSILCQEHKVQFELFQNMKKRGFVATSKSTPEEIQKIKQKYALNN